jgi:hypothetical protein
LTPAVRAVRARGRIGGFGPWRCGAVGPAGLRRRGVGRLLHAGKKLLVAGFHDPSGDAAHNAQLAKQRAVAVRAALVGQGAGPARVLLRKPEQTALGGPAEEARRVEVRLVD